MNANDSAQRAALDAAIDKRLLERGKLEQSAATVKRGERVAATAAEKVQNLERTMATAEIEQAYRLEAAIVADGPIAALPDVAAESLASALSSAKLNASIAVKALVSLQATHAQRQSEVQRAEAAVVQIVDQILDAEAEAIAAEIEQHLNQAICLGEKLRQYVPDALHTPINRPHAAVSPEIQQALDSLPKRRDDLNTPGDILRSGSGPDYAALAARRTAMIRGETDTNDSKAA